MRSHCRNAYAKINLVLAVGPKRPDGFHEVATILQAISLHDTLRFRARAKGFTLTVDGPESKGVPRTADNLVLRAARLLARELGETRGAAIALTKRIPHGAGLGGGSSDAAATLRGLLALWNRRLPRVRLDALAASLGSDVPFFLGKGLALATGRGEIVTPLRGARHSLRLVVLVPEVALSTAWVYAHYAIPKSRLTAGKRVVNLLPLRAEVIARTNVKRKFFNDLEGVVLRRFPAVREALHALWLSGAEHAQMSGSGSALFALPPPSVPPKVLVTRLRRRFVKVYVARSVGAGSRPCR